MNVIILGLTSRLVTQQSLAGDVWSAGSQAREETRFILHTYNWPLLAEAVAHLGAPVLVRTGHQCCSGCHHHLQSLMRRRRGASSWHGRPREMANGWCASGSLRGRWRGRGWR